MAHSGHHARQLTSASKRRAEVISFVVHNASFSKSTLSPKLTYAFNRAGIGTGDISKLKSRMVALASCSVGAHCWSGSPQLNVATRSLLRRPLQDLLKQLRHS